MSTNSVSPDWARPVLEEMGLAQAPAVEKLLAAHRIELEKSQLLEKIRSAVTQVNHEAGRQIIECQEFLAPARLVARLRFGGRGTSHCLEIAVRPDGPKAVFFTIKRMPRGLQRFFNNAANNRVTTVNSLYFRPEAVSEADVQSWIRFLLSEFKSKFQPATDAYGRVDPNPGRLNSAASLLNSL